MQPRWNPLSSRMSSSYSSSLGILGLHGMFEHQQQLAAAAALLQPVSLTPHSTAGCSTQCTCIATICTLKWLLSMLSATVPILLQGMITQQLLVTVSGLMSCCSQCSILAQPSCAAHLLTTVCSWLLIVAGQKAVAREAGRLLPPLACIAANEEIAGVFRMTGLEIRRMPIIIKMPTSSRPTRQNYR